MQDIEILRKSKKLSKETIELLEQPSIASQLPIVFNEDGQWDEFSGECNGCHKPIPQEALRGTIDRSWPNVATVTAAGFCRPCLLVTPFKFRVHSDMRMTFPRNGVWHEATPQPDGLWQQLLQFIKKAFLKNE